MVPKIGVVRNCTVQRLALREMAGGMTVSGRLCAVQRVTDHSASQQHGGERIGSRSIS